MVGHHELSEWTLFPEVRALNVGHERSCALVNTYELMVMTFVGLTFSKQSKPAHLLVHAYRPTG